jgi:hypothetical protein
MPFYCLMQNEQVQVHGSNQRVTGLVRRPTEPTQRPSEDIGVDEFEIMVSTTPPCRT